MDRKDKRQLVKRYEDRFEKHGYSAASLGWGNSGSQALRFSILAAEALKNPSSSVLDLGCGFADLYAFLRAGGWRGRYAGVDLVPSFIETARRRHPGLELVCGDWAELGPELGGFDYVIASGMLNVMPSQGEAMENLRFCLEAMFGLCRQALCLDFLSDRADYYQERAFHPSPMQVMEMGFGLTGAWPCATITCPSSSRSFCSETRRSAPETSSPATRRWPGPPLRLKSRLLQGGIGVYGSPGPGSVAAGQQLFYFAPLGVE